MTTTNLSTDPSGDDEITRAVFAAIEQLDPAKQHDILKSLQQSLQLGELPVNSAPSKVHRAIAALVEAAGLTGGKPLSYDRYRQLRLESPERKREWPSASNINRWLGVGKWNDALRRAHLEPLADGDVIVRQTGPRYTRDEVASALRECAAEIGVPPSFDAYTHWARRPDVQARPGRRPMSQSAFQRFDGFAACLKASGVVGSEPGAAGRCDAGFIRSASYRVDETELAAGLAEVAQRLGRSPRVTEYDAERQRIYEETAAAGHPRVIPSYNTLRRRHGQLIWDEILLHYGLTPLGGRHTGKKTGPKGPRGEELDRDEMLAILHEAWEAHDRKLTVAAYRAWRIEQALRDRKAGVIRRIPDYTSYWSYFGNWEKALRAATTESWGEAK